MENNDELLITSTQRGGYKAGYKGFLYNTNGKATLSFQSWRCEMYQSRRCKAKMKTNPKRTAVISLHSEHNHLPSKKDLEVAKLRGDIRKMATESRETTVQIVNRVMVGLPVSTQPSAPLPKSMKRTVQRIRAINQPAEPKNVWDYEMIEAHKSTFGDERFLLYDSKEESEEEDEEEEEDNDNGQRRKRRARIWASENSLKHLAKAKMWFMDGTHGVCPAQFQQVYIIMGKVYGVTVPFAFCLLTHKDSEMYTQLFDILKQNVDDADYEFNLEKGSLDFELACANAFRAVFGNVQVQFCFFHLGQSLYRKVQSCGLQRHFWHNDSFQEEFSQILAIAFVPVDDMETAFVALFETLSEEGKVIAQHIDDNYLRGKLQRVNRGREIRKRPLFQRQQWNVYQSILNDEPKTNNFVEAFNHRLKYVIGMKHPSIHLFCDRLKEEQRYTEGIIENALAGRATTQCSKKELQLKKNLHTLANKYHEREILEYLRGCAHNIKLRNLITVEIDEEEGNDND